MYCHVLKVETFECTCSALTMEWELNKHLLSEWALVGRGWWWCHCMRIWQKTDLSKGGNYAPSQLRMQRLE